VTQKIQSVVAEVSPSLYAAAKQANLNPIQTNQVEQMSFAIKKHRELSKMEPNAAKSAYDALDPNAQNSLKFLFKDSDYSVAPPDASDKVYGALKAGFGIVASPVVGLFKLAGNYNRLVNTPYLVARQAAQGADVFNSKTWSTAWNGKSVYDNGALDKAVNVFGAAPVEVAKGLLAGKTPGQIIIDYGKTDATITDAISQAFNNPKEFRQVMDGVKYAQVSPGRDLARMSEDKHFGYGGLHGDYVSGSTKNFSGVIDAVYQIVIDPLTWITGGSTKAANVGERLAATIKVAAERGNLPRGVADVFADRRVATLWNDQLGPKLKRYSEAKTRAEKTIIYNEISFDHPGYANRNIVDHFANNKLFDAAVAQKHFEIAENVPKLLSGSVEGMSYSRNGVVIARKQRHLRDGLSLYMDSLFNSSGSRTMGLLKTQGRTPDELEKIGNDAYDALRKAGETVDGYVNPNPDLSIIKGINSEIKGLKRFGKLAARSPMGLEIRTGSEAIQTAGNFTTVARQVVPKDVAEFLTTSFLESTQDQQLVIIRNLYVAIMDSYGLRGHAMGEKLINDTLRQKFGNKAGFGTLVKTEVNASHAKYAPNGTLKETESVPVLQSEDPIHLYHSTNAVGSLPYDEIMQMAVDIKSKKNLVNAIGGATQSQFAVKIVDAWSLLTLLPRLGIRSAIDEGLMFVLTAPSKDLLAFASRRGHQMGKMSTAFTGSKDATGPIREAIGKAFKNNVYDAVSLEKREQLLNDLASKLNIDSDLLRNVQKREEIGRYVEQIYGTRLDLDERAYLLQALVHQPDMLNSMASSMVARSGLSGRYGETVHNSIVDPSNLTLAIAELALKVGRRPNAIPTKDLSEAHLSLAHFDNWWKGFVANRKTLPNNRTVDPGRIFFENNGLKPNEIDPVSGKEWFEKALDEMVASIGVVYDDAKKIYVVKDQQAVDAYLALSSRTIVGRERGFSDADLVRDQSFRSLADLYTTFHGSANGFNQKLFDAVVEDRKRLTNLIKGKEGYTATWSQAAASMDFNRFIENTTAHRPNGEINSAIEFPGFQEVESVWRRYGDKGMEWMDRQINAIYRQPALMVTYTQVRKNYAGVERQWVKDMKTQMIKDDPTRYKTKSALDRLDLEVKSMGEKRFTEIATEEAANTILKYADNPAIRSNFAYGVRTVGRYYRATEDFQRRMFRLKDVPLRVLYRMRLAHLGLSASGSVFTDANGDMYVTMPMDNIIFKATDTTMRALTGNLGYSQPAFNEFTFKLKMVNPSFQQDAGLPMLSGPIAGLGVIAMRNILGYTNNLPFIGTTVGPIAQQAGLAVDQFALGSMGENTNIARAVVPASLQRIWGLLPFDEKSRQEVTAGQQAMAYNAAHGLSLDANSTDREKAEYLKNIRISAHNVLFLRNFLGLVLPATPTVQESKGIPDYLKRVGITGLRPEFFDILNGITKVGTGDVQDPYELALFTFTGKYPGKLIYTVSRDSKQTSVVVKNTDGLKNWAIANQGLVKKYGEAAYIFAPQVGEFNAATYNWVKAAGLVQSKTLEQYYTDLAVAQDKQSYYDIASKEKELLASTLDLSERANIIKQATMARNALKIANPLLNAALIGQGNNIGSEGKLLSSVEELLSDPDLNIENATRERMSIAIKMVKEYISFATDPETKNIINFVDLKRERRDQIEEALKDLTLGDLTVAEANRAIFKSILSFYSRDSYVVFKKGY
jgi:hypothetical protein